jgi:hypothetical protein
MDSIADLYFHLSNLHSIGDWGLQFYDNLMGLTLTKRRPQEPGPPVVGGRGSG